MTHELGRRATQFPGSSEPGISWQEGNVSGDTVSASTAPRKLKRRYQPPRLPLPVVPSSTGWTESSKRPASEFCQNASPWRTYNRLLTDDEAGPVIIAHEHTLNFPMVAIKQRGLDQNWNLRRLIRVEHSNIVSLLAAYRDASELYLVYESMAVSLSQIQRCPHGPLREYEIAIIYKEVYLPASDPWPME